MRMCVGGLGTSIEMTGGSDEDALPSSDSLRALRSAFPPPRDRTH